MGASVLKRALADKRLPRKYANRKKYPFTVTPEGELEGAPLYDGGEEEEDDGAGPLMHEELLPEEPPAGVPPALWAALRAGGDLVTAVPAARWTAALRIFVWLIFLEIGKQLGGNFLSLPACIGQPAKT